MLDFNDIIFGNIAKMVLVIALLLTGIQTTHVDDTDLLSENGGSTTLRSTYTCPAGSKPVLSAACLTGCKQGNKVETFSYDQSSRYDGCNTCSTHVYRYPDGTICEDLEMCTLKACSPIRSMLPGSDKADDSEDDD